MKIAIDCHTLEIKGWAGKEQFLISIIKELAKKDQESKYILYFKKKVLAENDFPPGWTIKSIRLPTPFWQLYVLADLLIRRVNILVCPCAYLLSALNIFIPLVVVIHDLTTFLPDTSGFHKKMTKFKERLLLGLSLKNAKKIIAVSENTKKDIIKKFKTEPEKIVVISEAADKRFKVIKENKVNKILKKYNIQDDYILFVGTLEPRKNLVKLIKSYYRLVIHYNLNKFKLVLVGKKGWYYQDIFNLVKKFKLEDKIIFTGYLPDEDIPCLCNGAKCFVYVSLYEGFGLPPLEAMACGCPVIASNNSSLPEVAGKAAILVNPQNINEIAAVLHKVLTDDLIREKMRQKGLQRAQEFTWGKTADQILNLLKEIDLT